MHRIDDPTAAADKHGPGKNGFTIGDALMGIAATRPTADIADAVQEELAAPIEALGMALDKANHQQLREVLWAMFDAFILRNWFEVVPDHASGATALAVDPGGRLCAVGAGASFTTSDDVVSQAALPGNSLAVAHDGSGLWCAVGLSLGMPDIRTSPDAITWTYRSSVTAGTLLSIAHDGSGLWCAVGDTGSILTSPDGITWTAQTSGTLESLNSVAYDGSGLWCAVGEVGKILTSPDGVVWTPQASGTVEALHGVAHDGSGLWCAVGFNGTLLTSPDGITWTAQTSGTTDNISAVAHDQLRRWCAVDEGGGIRTSSGGQTWEPLPIVCMQPLYCIARGSHGVWYVGGADSVIRTLKWGL